ncbi:hypothetical protein [Burkholderia ubonensis]|uniref:hypothetical protein n=1 Tax=Burkholderia ubonensis TaxID=101571 RepID=UPI000AB7D3E4|nr:hypothetical protein [Burkholderia ubonensis]
MADPDNNQQLPQQFPTEYIPDPDNITRLVDFPRMYEPVRSLIWENVFEFPGGTGESVNWDKYAPLGPAVHKLGCEREQKKRESRVDFRYAGYVPARTGDVREIRNARGHGFAVDHVPSEGQHHAEIRYAAAADAMIRKGDKVELKAALKDKFGPLVAHACEAGQ